jgi:hypothetical protein
MEEKLAKLRQKYGKTGQQAKKPPVLIEAPRLNPEKASRMPDDIR